ncbi:hypothetical protein PR202_gb21786 [Eleusine coracana subsp. coracana]|uniref:Uncharacterized protein n=1 Tax=Eleusine coracana subsp. coracana TaxID=191504 RepID=A0AAV5FEA3_ELECO|nr:hypothetical protein PR202_gb21786 [Eleusine coracana subsp. coracana]
MGRGRNRKPRNFATFRLCPRPGAADASDRVFVRVDDNPYTVPGFGNDDGHGPDVGPSSSGSPTGGDDAPSFSSADNGIDALPDHVRREILELGLPDDGYDYLAHLRELRPSLSSTGGGASAVFLSSRRPARSGLPPDVKVHPFQFPLAYDLSGVTVGSVEAAETEVVVTRVEEVTDLDVAKQLEESDSLGDGLEDEDLEDDFVVVANQPDEVEGEVGDSLPHEQFHSLALERDAEGKGKQTSEISDAIPDHAGCAVRYSSEHSEEEQVVLVPQCSDGSAVRHCAATVSRSYLDVQSGEILVPDSAKKKLPKFSPGETSMKKVIIKKSIEKLPTEYLPQRRTSSGDTSKQGSYKEPREETKET